jgi:geranylgeranyl diphosphate synthase type II
MPIAYILGIGGKRIRPVLTLMTTEVLMEIIKALPAAMAVFP